MKILVVNGSPRLKGNTKTALNSLVSAIEAQHPTAALEQIDVTKYALSGCINCNSCKKNGGDCVLPDDSAMLLTKVAEADVVILGSPVYWWGISAQLKMLVDKFYSKVSQFQTQNKKLGIISVGGNTADDPQYRLIKEQFACICAYLGWKLLFAEGFCAYDIGDLAKATGSLKTLTSLGELV